MIRIDIPGSAPLELEHVVCDYNGTLASDGGLLPGVRDRLVALAGVLTIHVVTADTFGTASDALWGLDLRVTILAPTQQSVAKAEYVTACGAQRTVAIGNGCNDRDMLAAAALSIAVLGDEGTATASLTVATVVARDILVALDLLLIPNRLVATLRR
jgi:soluble P-type ATPase